MKKFKNPNEVDQRLKCWAKLRLQYLNEHPFCENCLRYDKYSFAEEVHHKTFLQNGKTVEDRLAILLDWNNLMSLCRDCHHRFHAYAKAHNLTRIDNLSPDTPIKPEVTSVKFLDF